MNRETQYHNALLWAFDRLGVEEMTPKEIMRTMIEIGKVLRGEPSPASTYESKTAAVPAGSARALNR